MHVPTGPRGSLLFGNLKKRQKVKTKIGGKKNQPNTITAIWTFKEAAFRGFACNQPRSCRITPTSSLQARYLAQTPSLISTDYPKSHDGFHVGSGELSPVPVAGRQLIGYSFSWLLLRVCVSLCHAPHAHTLRACALSASTCATAVRHLLFRIFSLGTLTPSAAAAASHLHRAVSDQRILQLVCVCV